MTLLRSSILFTIASLSLAASAQNLVVNGGFETGDLAGWTVAPAGGNQSFVGVTSQDPRSGSFAAFFGSYEDRDTITQSIATIVGRSYTVSYYVQTRDGNRLADLTGTFGDGSQTTSGGSFGYTLFQFSTVATSTSTLLSFTGRNTESTYLLDDVSVVAAPVPEPASLVAFGLGAVGLLRCRKRA